MYDFQLSEEKTKTIVGGGQLRKKERISRILRCNNRGVYHRHIYGRYVLATDRSITGYRVCVC